MGLVERVKTIFAAKANKIVDDAENPCETLDYAYERQLEMILRVKKALTEVTASRIRLETAQKAMVGKANLMENAAKESLKAGKNDMAKTQLENQITYTRQAQAIELQLNAVREQENKLLKADAKLATQVETLRIQKESLKAQYTATEAQTKMAESLTGINNDLSDIGAAVDRATGKIEKMQAKSDAIVELVDKGVLTDPTNVLNVNDTGVADEAEQKLQELMKNMGG